MRRKKKEKEPMGRNRIAFLDFLKKKRKHYLI